MIYVFLNGRIGNQLFMYSVAENIRKEYKNNEKIIIDDTWVKNKNWENSLENYNLENVEYVHKRSKLFSFSFILPVIALVIYKFLSDKKDYNEKYLIEKKYQKFFNKMGLIVCENGFLPFTRYRKNIVLFGYFQSENYFLSVNNDIKNIFNLKDKLNSIKVSDLELIRKSNTVCISIKVQHNVGSEIYDVCTKEYWKHAINYITDHVSNPIFFICSDNVDYVKKNLIDCSKHKVIYQDKDLPVYISLAIMGQCKHFIIGNTSFGWWAQYLSDYKNKIVIAPKKWTNCDMKVDLYDDNWILI